MVITDVEKHLVWKEHYEGLLNVNSLWNKESFLEAPLLGPQPQIDKESVKSAPPKMKKDKASGSSGVVTKIFLASGDAGFREDC